MENNLGRLAAFTTNTTFNFLLFCFLYFYKQLIRRKKSICVFLFSLETELNAVNESGPGFGLSKSVHVEDQAYLFSSFVLLGIWPSV